jgi:D-glycero-D-manno-heptose 1,7-bisphosphate phosphatase
LTGRAVFLDRDGVINQVIMRNGEPRSPRTREEFVLNEDAVDMVQILKSIGFLTIVITNQPDIARGKLRREDLDWMLEQVRQRCQVDDILVCPHDDSDACSCRKPLPGMILNGAQKLGIDLVQSFMIGDTWKDRDAASAAGCRFILIDTPYNQNVECDLRVAGLKEAVEYVLDNMGEEAAPLFLGTH